MSNSLNFLFIFADFIVNRGELYNEVEQSGSTLQSSVNDLQHEAAGMRRRLRMPDVD